MINHFPTPLPDELFYSLCARYADRVQYSDIEAVNKELFGARGMSAGVGLPSHLGHLVESLPAKHELTVDRLIDQHTLFPFYSPFLPVERCNRVRKDMQGMKGSTIYNCAGITPSNVRLPDWFRYCPNCAAEDKELYRQPYWHRLHQVPGVEVCPIHEVFLENSSEKARNRTNTALYVSARSVALSQIAHALNSSDRDHQALLGIARDAAWLLSQHRVSTAFNSLRDRYLLLLAERGLSTSDAKAHVKKLLQALSNSYSPNLLEWLQCGFNEKKRFNWPSLLVAHIRHNKTDPPIRHLLVIQVLGQGAESFFSAPTVRKPTNALSEVKPFGNGPWPCLNLACKASGKLVIKTCQVKYGSPRPSPPVGVFTCVCGFSYSRKGPDRSPQDKYRSERVYNYGRVWEAALRKLWRIPSISMAQIARDLGVSEIVIKYHAIRLELIPRRHQPGSRAVHVNPQYQELIRQRRIKKSSTNKAKTIKSKRREGLKIRVRHPTATRKELKRSIASSIYSFLFKFDQKWLKAHQPPLFKRVGSACQVNWESRDIHLAQRVRDSASRLKSVATRPTRVTRQLIGRDIDAMTSLSDKHALSKLPLTVEALEEVVETRVEFAIRRIRWAADCFRQENILPALSTLGLRSGINHSIWYVPEVKAAFEAALSALRQS